jgi:hypothetical protein
LSSPEAHRTADVGVHCEKTFEGYPAKPKKKATATQQVSRTLFNRFAIFLFNFGSFISRLSKMISRLIEKIKNLALIFPFNGI